MEVIINGSQITNESDLHRVLADQLDFGPFYGNNLAALRDRLTTDVERPIHLVWKDAEVSRKSLGDMLFQRICDLLQNVERKDSEYGWEDRFTFVLS